ncbi:MAG: CoA-binding protein [Pseudomonadota bacterium]
MNHDSYPDAYVKAILDTTKTIAMVGASANWNRPSYFAMKYLQGKGYRVLPVNPRAAGQTILGETCVANLNELTEKVDMVDIFRNSDAAGAIVDEALAMSPRPRTIWMQLGVRNDTAAKHAESQGLQVVMNRCPKIEYARLNGELGWQGLNSRVISSKRRKLAS